MPAASAPAPTCEGSCTIDSNSFGYTPPAMLVPSGSSVSWSAFDTGHVTVDGLGNEELDSFCVRATHNPLEESAAVRFDVEDGALYATTGSETLACVNAKTLPDGGFALPYNCLLHPLMRGTLVVREA